MKLSELQGKYKIVGGSVSEPKPEQPKKDLLQTASDVGGFLFPGTKQIGESLGTIAAAGGRAIQGDLKGAGEILDTQVPIPRLIGAYTAAGASAAGSAGVGTTGGFLTKALQSAGIGAAISGGREAAEGGSLKEVAGSTTLGAGVGAGTSLAFSGGEAILKSFRSLPERLIRSATGQTKKQILAGKDISKYVLDNKKIGTADQLIKQSQQAIDEADTFIGESLRSVSDKSISLKDVLSDIAGAVNQAGGDIDEVGVRSVLERLAPQVKKTLSKESLSLAEANLLRSQLDKTLGSNVFISSQVPFDKGLLLDFTNSLRDQVKGQAPQGVRQAFSTLSNELSLRNLLLSKAAGASRNQIISLSDILSGGFGGAVGGVPGAIAGASVKRAAESTVFKTATANIVSSLDRSLSPILEQLEPAAQTAIINALVQAFQSLGPTKDEE